MHTNIWISWILLIVLKFNPKLVLCRLIWWTLPPVSTLDKSHGNCNKFIRWSSDRNAISPILNQPTSYNELLISKSRNYDQKRCSKILSFLNKFLRTNKNWKGNSYGTYIYNLYIFRLQFCWKKIARCLMNSFLYLSSTAQTHILMWIENETQRRRSAVWCSWWSTENPNHST